MPVQSIIHISQVKASGVLPFRRLTLRCSAAHALHALLSRLGNHVTDEVVLSETPLVPARERPRCRVKPRRGNV